MQSGAFFSDRENFYFTRSLSPLGAASSDVYLKQKISLSIAGIVLALAYFAVLSFTGAVYPFIHAAGISGNLYVSFLTFVLAVEVFYSFVKFPLDFYGEFILEHRFGLSNETFLKWLLRRLKAAAVGAVLGVIVLLAFYFLLVNFPGTWWLLFAAFFFLFQILVAQLFPTLILPLFFKLKPIDDEALSSRLRTLVERFGYRMSGVYSFDLSRETRKANAALTGLGRSRKIIISDTLISNFGQDEIEVVLSHELGHLVKHHMMKGILISAAVSLIGFFIMAHIYSAYTSAAALRVYELRAIPFLALLVTMFGAIAMPAGNFYSRRIEHEADAFALETTGMSAQFAESMRKLGKLNMTPENPPAWIEKIFFSHPSIGARIRFALHVESRAAESASGKTAK